jgi:methionine-rich copper-binding protein CopC
MMSTRFLSLAAALATASIVSTVAEAHPHLTHSDPAPGAVLKSAPSAIRMIFSEGLVPRFTGLSLVDGHGGTIPTGSADVGGRDNTELTVAVRSKLAPGTYSVRWHAVSVDTHRVTGSYSFKVKG